MVYGPSNFKFKDYFKMGILQTLIFMNRNSRYSLLLIFLNG